MDSTSSRNLERSRASNGIPRGALLGAWGLVFLTLVLVFTDQALDAYRGEQTVSAPQTVHSLYFEDRGDDGMAVFRPADAEPLAVLPAEGNSFLNSVVHSLAHIREREGVPSDVPFQLVRWTDGTMILADPATGEYMPLNGFGRDNEAAFLDVLAAAEQRS